MAATAKAMPESMSILQRRQSCSCSSSSSVSSPSACHVDTSGPHSSSSVAARALPSLGPRAVCAASGGAIAAAHKKSLSGWLKNSAPGFCARQHRRASTTSRNPRPLVVCMGIRAVENFEASFELIPESKEILFTLLSSDIFCEQVKQQPGVAPDTTWRFTELVFQPVPWSPATKHGMKQEFEKYLHDKTNYVIVNVPPNYMFQAKIFKPSRLCAIFERRRDGEQALESSSTSADSAEENQQ